MGKVEVALGRGEEVILMGDFNRPFLLLTPSHGTKLLLEWEKTGQVKILNNKNVHTRIDPATKKGVNTRPRSDIHQPEN